MVDITTIIATINIIISILSHHFFFAGMDLCLVVQASIWEKSLGYLQEIFC